jgi:rfaE bifunctional protein nucleotidyltransferase chain/domain
MHEDMVTHPRNDDGSVDPLFKTYAQKVVLDYDKLSRIAEGYKAIGRKIVVTIGSWDAIHIGQVRYIIRARATGDILVVGFDTDRAIKLYKGDFRPLIPEAERAEMLTYLHDADFVTALDDVDENGNWQYGLLKAMRPDIFVAVEDSYPEEQIKEIQQYVAEPVVVLRRQADTSTSALIAKLLKGHLTPAYKLAHDMAMEEVLSGIQKRKLPTRSDTPVRSSAA